MLDANFIGDGDLPLPAGVFPAPPFLIGHNSATLLSTIRAKAERIVSLLSGIDGSDGQTDHNLSLAEELAQDIAELCPACGGVPDCIH